MLSGKEKNIRTVLDVWYKSAHLGTSLTQTPVFEQV
jgi:hypothetical protein